MNPLHALLLFVNTARLAEPVRLWLYGVGSVLLTGLALAGCLTGEWVAYGMTALGVVLALPAAELARLGAYSPNTVNAAGLAGRAALAVVGRHSGRVTVVDDRPTTFVHRVPPVPAPAAR